MIPQNASNKNCDKTSTVASPSGTSPYSYAKIHYTDNAISQPSHQDQSSSNTASCFNCAIKTKNTYQWSRTHDASRWQEARVRPGGWPS